MGPPQSLSTYAPVKESLKSVNNWRIYRVKYIPTKKTEHFRTSYFDN